MSVISQICGKPMILPGDNIDTDRIVPARYLKSLTFDALGEHVFADDRSRAKREGRVHPFDNEFNIGARFLVVDENFGCGSSREHAAQALRRWGINAIVGRSFGEIFFGNCVSVGLPCCVLEPNMHKSIKHYVQCSRDPIVHWDLVSQAMYFGAEEAKPIIPEGPRKQLVDGTWDATSMLLKNLSRIREIDAEIGTIDGLGQR